MEQDGSFIVGLIRDLGPWAWLIGGVVLLALELALPGSFLMWLGLGAIIVGIGSFFFDLTWQVQWISFGALAIILLVLGRRFFAADRTQSDQPHLNERGLSLVGRQVTLREPISDNEGRVKIGDTLWRVTGPNLPSGSRVEVHGADGATLMVRAVSEAD